ACPGPMNSVAETFTDAERALLAPHFSNLDRPVFALTNLPETVKGAMFARYSRYQGTLRRLVPDEVGDSLPAGAVARAVLRGVRRLAGGGRGRPRRSLRRQRGRASSRTVRAHLRRLRRR